MTSGRPITLKTLLPSFMFKGLNWTGLVLHGMETIDIKVGEIGILSHSKAINGSELKMKNVSNT